MNPGIRFCISGNLVNMTPGGSEHELPEFSNTCIFGALEKTHDIPLEITGLLSRLPSVKGRFRFPPAIREVLAYRFRNVALCSLPGTAGRGEHGDSPNREDQELPGRDTEHVCGSAPDRV